MYLSSNASLGESVVLFRMRSEAEIIKSTFKRSTNRESVGFTLICYVILYYTSLGLQGTKTAH